MSATIEQGEIKTIFRVDKVKNEIKAIPFLGLTSGGRVKLPRMSSPVKPNTSAYFYTEYEEKAKNHLSEHLEKRQKIKQSASKERYKLYYVWRIKQNNYDVVTGKKVGGKLLTKTGVSYSFDNEAYILTTDRDGVKMLRDMFLDPDKYFPKAQQVEQREKRKYVRKSERKTEFQN